MVTSAVTSLPGSSTVLTLTPSARVSVVITVPSAMVSTTSVEPSGLVVVSVVEPPLEEEWVRIVRVPPT